uniref:Calponin-homology (CH) domain-containing protein n=1 Tax=Clastoptera arizonana TaxID=38151 RepID=A0A1B6E3F7_9HEMI
MNKFKSFFRRGHNNNSASSTGLAIKLQGNGSHTRTTADVKISQPNLEPAEPISCMDIKTETAKQITQTNEMGDSESNFVESKRKEESQQPKEEKSDLEFQTLELVPCGLETLRNEVCKEKKDTSYCVKSANSSLSELSIASLQDWILHISKLEETHQSTNEELQATLQELGDLQLQLKDLQTHNNRLGEQKTILLDSLVKQTERLQEVSGKVGPLDELVNSSDVMDSKNLEERELAVLNLIKNAQEERTILMVKKTELENKVNLLARNAETSSEERIKLAEKVTKLESIITEKEKEKLEIDLEVIRLKNECSIRDVDIKRLSAYLVNAETKIRVLEFNNNISDSEHRLLLATTRQENFDLKNKMTLLNDQLSRSEIEAMNCEEQLTHHLKYYNKFKTSCDLTMNQLKNDLNKAMQENNKIVNQLVSLKDEHSKMQVYNDCHQKDKKELNTILYETQKVLSDSITEINNLKTELVEVKRHHEQQTSEWREFQKDLLTAVRVANDFKTEANAMIEETESKNQQLHEIIESLRCQIDRLQTIEKPMSPSMLDNESRHVLPSVIPEVKRSEVIQETKSVKSLIDVIENITKQTICGQKTQRSGSTSSLTSTVGSPTVPLSPVSDFEIRNTTTPLRDQQLYANRQQAKQLIYTEEFVKGSKILIEESLPALAPRMEYPCKNGSGDRELDEVKNVIVDQQSVPAPLPEHPCKNGSDDCKTNVTCRKQQDPLAHLAKSGGSKRNALLRWCQIKTSGYKNIDITNFSSSWNDGLAFCALMHSYLPDLVPYDTLIPSEKRRNFTVAFSAAESVGIKSTLSINDMVEQERPSWQLVIDYITSIFTHFEA